ncbi:MAG TPA: tetratricopeptide repeat protein [Methanoregula sp.]|nr:tetratricopeptide repeat protein [Methanoregula sp.]
MHIRTGLLVIIMTLMIITPALAAEDIPAEKNPWYWYNQAVDLANAGQFSAALEANDKALSLNESMPLAWANKAGILVQLGRYEEAIAAADHVVSVNTTELPNAYAAAYYSKGDALRALGRMNEAADAYARAYKLDSSLVPPLTVPGSTSGPATPSPTKSPLNPGILVASVLIALACCKVCSRHQM